MDIFIPLPFKSIKMSNGSTISCPISVIRINENVARVAAFYTFLIAITSLLSHSYLLTFLLGVDFAIRSFLPSVFSPLRFISGQTAILLDLKKVPVDAAPKRFAAGVGFLFCFLIATCQLFDFNFASYLIGSVLLICAFLESVFAYCVGCVVYTFLQRIFKKSNVNGVSAF